MIFLKTENFPQVPKIYEILSVELSTLLPHAKIDHIGSTSIAGALTKGDLDILVRVQKSDFETTLLEIKEIGFTEKFGTLRTPSLCMLVTEKYDWDVAIQLVEAGSQFEDFLKFRDRLNADPALVNEYNQLKLSASGADPVEYRAKKSTFIERVLAIVEE
ncbi:MAG: GrpB family protein [Proteobacteria bacterium]|nr:MAG: GrpB family protein [Pseudomonadota bacterium]